jgi:oligoendopeptidase F
MSQLIQIRTQTARNCGFDSYTDYKFSYRYDYTKEQINQFHESIRTVVTPIIEHFFIKRNEIWKLDKIMPYDLNTPLVAGVDSELFATTEEMIDKLCLLLHDMNPELEQFIRHMQLINNLDLETRKNKAP